MILLNYHIIIEILEIVIFLILIIILLYKKRTKISKDIRKTLKIYSAIRRIMKISNADFIAFFNYNVDDDKHFITTELMLLMDKDENINDMSYERLPVSINPYSLKVFNTKDENIYELYKDDNFRNERNIFDNTFKIYYQNIYNNDLPSGYMLLSYEKEYKMVVKDQKEISNIISIIKKLNFF